MPFIELVHLAAPGMVYFELEQEPDSPSMVVTINNRARIFDRSRPMLLNATSAMAFIAVVVPDVREDVKVTILRRIIDELYDTDVPLKLARIQPRLNADREALREAYSDPDVAAMAEMTTGGIKTRDRFHKRN